MGIELDSVGVDGADLLQWKSKMYLRCTYSTVGLQKVYNKNTLSLASYVLESFFDLHDPPFSSAYLQNTARITNPSQRFQFHKVTIISYNDIHVNDNDAG